MDAAATSSVHDTIRRRIPFHFQFPSKRWQSGPDGTEYSCRRCLLTESIKSNDANAVGQNKHLVDDQKKDVDKGSQDHLDRKDGWHWVHEVVLKPVALRHVNKLDINRRTGNIAPHLQKGRDETKVQHGESDVGRPVHRDLERILLEDYQKLDPLRFVTIMSKQYKMCCCISMFGASRHFMSQDVCDNVHFAS